MFSFSSRGQSGTKILVNPIYEDCISPYHYIEIDASHCLSKLSKATCLTHPIDLPWVVATILMGTQVPFHICQFSHFSFLFVVSLPHDAQDSGSSQTIPPGCRSDTPIIDTLSYSRR